MRRLIPFALLLGLVLASPALIEEAGLAEAAPWVVQDESTADSAAGTEAVGMEDEPEEEEEEVVAEETAWWWIVTNLLRLNPESPPDFVVFLGRFHPLVLHLPIAFLLLALFLEILARFRGQESLRPALRPILGLSVLTSVAAVVAGLLLSVGDSYEPELLNRHMWLGLGVMAFSVVLYVLEQRRDRAKVWDLAYVGSIVATAVLVVAASHFGGSITHGQGYLTEYMPDPMRRVAGLPPKPEKIEARPIEDIDAALVYRDIIHPILDDRCITCHRPGKTRGDLRLDAPEQILLGGESGEVIVPGRAEDSDLYRRLILEEDDEDHMPKERESLTNERIALIRWWIDSGAPFEQTVAEAGITDDIAPILETLTSGGRRGVFALEIEPAPVEAVEEIRSHGVLVMPVAEEETLLDVQTTNVKTAFSDSTLRGLLPIAEQVTWLNLGNTRVTDVGLEVLSEFPHLTRLHLENTAITDAGLEHLAGLEYLEYLNLYGTAVTDRGLEHLSGLENLAALYLWQTEVTPDGADRLRQRLPSLTVNMGGEAAPSDSVATPEATD